MSALQKNVMKSRLPGLGLPPSGMSSSSRHGRRAGRQRDFTPLHWSSYFTSCRDVKTSDNRNSFRVYERGNEGPLVVLLHGGGFSALTWAVLSSQLTELVHCRILAMDLRDHGCSKTAVTGNLDIDTMACDVIAVLKAVFEEEIPPIVLVGHSMGGAVAVHTTIQEELPIMGLVVIDVVEGSAMDALTSMQSFLRSRPKSFSSISTAIEWSLKSGQVRNLESARVSMPGQLKNVETNDCACEEVITTTSEGETSTSPDASSLIQHGESIEEEDEEKAEFKQPATTKPSESGYTWRIDLTQTEPFWHGWFQGLSSKFLSAKAAKLLLLAGVDRLDKDLTVGQMQGKFQMHVLPQCGHAVHEDVPDKVAEVLASFLLRNKFTTPKSDFQRVFPAC